MARCVQGNCTNALENVPNELNLQNVNENHCIIDFQHTGRGFVIPNQSSLWLNDLIVINAGNKTKSAAAGPVPKAAPARKLLQTVTGGIPQDQPAGGGTPPAGSAGGIPVATGGGTVGGTGGTGTGATGTSSTNSTGTGGTSTGIGPSPAPGTAATGGTGTGTTASPASSNATASPAATGPVAAVAGGVGNGATHKPISQPNSSGGAVFIEIGSLIKRGTLYANNVIFFNNFAVNGGAVGLNDHARASLVNCVFDSNQASGHGGAPPPSVLCRMHALSERLRPLLLTHAADVQQVPVSEVSHGAADSCACMEGR